MDNIANTVRNTISSIKENFISEYHLVADIYHRIIMDIDKKFFS